MPLFYFSTVSSNMAAVPSSLVGRKVTVHDVGGKCSHLSGREGEVIKEGPVLGEWIVLVLDRTQQVMGVNVVMEVELRVTWDQLYAEPAPPKEGRHKVKDILTNDLKLKSDGMMTFVHPVSHVAVCIMDIM